MAKKAHNLKGTGISYGISFLTVLLISIFLAVALGIYPFGENGLLFVDGFQYFSVASYVQRALLSKETLLYSWGNTLGGNALPLIAYYASSPFNLLLVLFRNNLLLGVHVLVLIKLICAALAFCLLLNYRTEGFSWAKGILSGCYPFIGYAISYIWNISWLDGLVILPLVTLGIDQLVTQRKFLLYTLSLAFSIFSNYYIGFMLCIWSVLFYILKLALDSEGPVKALRRSLPLFCICSLLAGGLGILPGLPAILALPPDRTQSFSDLIRENEVLVSYPIMATMLRTGNWGLLQKAPSIFVGIPSLVLVLIYFFNGSIPGKKKLCYGSLILFFLLSFHYSLPSSIWHGTSAPNSFFFRYSFLFSFFLLLIAFESLVHLPQCKTSGVLAGLLALLILIPRGNGTVSSSAGILDAVLIFLSVGCCLVFAESRWTVPAILPRCSSLLLGLALVFNMAENGFLSIPSASFQNFIPSLQGEAAPAEGPFPCLWSSSICVDKF